MIRLDEASAPPIGVAEPADIVEARVALSDHAVLAMYTDGLIERRGQNIDEGIDLLGRVIVAAPNARSRTGSSGTSAQRSARRTTTWHCS